MTMGTPPGFVPLFGLRKARVVPAPLIAMPVNAGLHGHGPLVSGSGAGMTMGEGEGVAQRSPGAGIQKRGMRG